MWFRFSFDFSFGVYFKRSDKKKTKQNFVRTLFNH